MASIFLIIFSLDAIVLQFVMAGYASYAVNRSTIFVDHVYHAYKIISRSAFLLRTPQGGRQ